MRFNYRKSMIKTALIALAILLPIAGVARAQTVSLTAAEQAAVQPDGVSIPMWGWVCGAASGATCTALNGAAQAGGTTWQPPLITVPMGSSLSVT